MYRRINPVRNWTDCAWNRYIWEMEREALAEVTFVLQWYCVGMFDDPLEAVCGF